MTKMMNTAEQLRHTVELNYVLFMLCYEYWGRKVMISSLLYFIVYFFYEIKHLIRLARTSTTILHKNFKFLVLCTMMDQKPEISFKLKK